MSKLVRAKDDSIDRLVTFLAKRDGIDKLVKTFQYIFKLLHWRLQHKNPGKARDSSRRETLAGKQSEAGEHRQAAEIPTRRPTCWPWC